MFSITAPLPSHLVAQKWAKTELMGETPSFMTLKSSIKSSLLRELREKKLGTSVSMSPMLLGDVFKRVLHTKLEAVAGALQLNAVGGLLLHSRPG